MNIKQLSAALKLHVVSSKFDDNEKKFVNLIEGNNKNVEIFGVNYIRETDKDPVKIDAVPIYVRLENAQLRTSYTI